jgi:hypothetical protein
MTTALHDRGRRRALSSLGALGLMLAVDSRADDGAPANLAIGDPALVFVDRLPPYVPREPVKGIVALWGHGGSVAKFASRRVSDMHGGLFKRLDDDRLQG